MKLLKHTISWQRVIAVKKGYDRCFSLTVNDRQARPGYFYDYQIGSKGYIVSTNPLRIETDDGKFYIEPTRDNWEEVIK